MTTRRSPYDRAKRAPRVLRHFALAARIVGVGFVLAALSGCGLWATSERTLWRTHEARSRYAFTADAPVDGARRVYQYVAFGDSIPAGLDSDHPTERVRSYAEGLAITISRRSNDTPVRFYQYAYSGRGSAEILSAMRTYMDVISDAQFITWDAGGNDMFVAREAFVDGVSAVRCRVSRLEQALVTLRANWSAIKALIRVGDSTHRSRRDAVIRAMNLYYPDVTRDRDPATACTDPETNIHHASVFDAYLPFFARANWHFCNAMYEDHDARLRCADAFAAFNAHATHRSDLSYQTGESEEHYVARVVAARDAIIDARENYRRAVLLLQDDRVHPTEEGHELLEALHSLPVRLPEPAARSSER